MKYLEIRIIKHVQYFYAENYEPLMKEIKEDLNKKRIMLYPRIEKLNIVKMLILLKLIYRVSAIPIKHLATFL